MKKLKAVAVIVVVAALLSGCAAMTPALQALERDIGALYRGVTKVITSTPAEERPALRASFDLFPSVKPQLPMIPEPSSEAPKVVVESMAGMLPPREPAEEPVTVTPGAVVTASLARTLLVPESARAETVQTTVPPEPASDPNVTCDVKGKVFTGGACAIVEKIAAGQLVVVPEIQKFWAMAVVKQVCAAYGGKLDTNRVGERVGKGRKSYFEPTPWSRCVIDVTDTDDDLSRNTWLLRKPPPGTAGTGFTTIRRPAVSSGRR